MKKPEEIKKGLGYCIAGPCPRQECPYYGSVPSCGYQRTKDALAYIQQLEAGIEEWGMVAASPGAVEDMARENARLTDRVKQIQEQNDIIIESFRRLKTVCVEQGATIQQLEAKVPRWISVEEQPEPPEDGEYWCYGYWIGSGRKQVETAEYLGGEWKIVNNFVLTHWMPFSLPEPPEEDAK